MVYEELPTALPFYKSISMQNRYKMNIPSEDVFQLLVENDRLIPFQFRTVMGNSISKIEVFTEDNILFTTLRVADVISEQVAGYQYFTWYGDEPFKLLNSLSLNLPCNNFYIRVTLATGGQLFSEVFSTMIDSIEYFKLEWTNDKWDIDPVYYGSGFVNRIYSDTFITKGIPTIEVDSEKDGYGNTAVISKKMVENFDFSLMVCPNYMVRAINFMSIHNSIYIYTKDRDRSGRIENVDVEQEQVNALALWEIIIKYTQDQFFFNGSCPTPITPFEIQEIIINTGNAFNEYELVYNANI